jgi:diguanylate cyclase (GGDEF)-like protein/PAS domain S-box-containing protein
LEALAKLDAATDLVRLQEVLVDTLLDGVYFVDRARRILYWNAAAERLTGYGVADVIGRRCADGLLRHCDAAGRCLCGDGCPLAAVMEDGQLRQAHVFLHHADGHRVPVHVRAAPMYDRQGRIIGALEVFSDDTDRINAIERLKELERDALLDELTGLANRRFFNRAIDACFAAYGRHETPFGLLLIDIDHFKRFNDTHGHDVGDAVLRLVGRTLAHGCRAHDTAARWGGEEFAVLTSAAEPSALSATAERLRALIAASGLDRDGMELGVTASVGGARVRPGDTPERLIQRADRALYAAKLAGRNRVTIGG